MSTELFFWPIDNIGRICQSITMECQLANTPSTAFCKRLDWVKLNMRAPEGYTNYASCGDSRCFAPEHIGFREKLTRDWNNWKPIRERIIALAEGESFDLEDFPHKDVNKMRCGVQSGIGFVHFITRNLPGSREGVRIIRIGEYYGDQREWEQSFPVVDKRVGKIKPWQRPAIIWLGQNFNPTFRREAISPHRCSVAGCAFPVKRLGTKYCYQHIHFFDYPMSMTDNKLDRNSLFRASEPYQPYALAAEFLISTANLEKSLRVQRDGYLRHDHKNSGGEDSKPERTPQPLDVNGMIDAALSRHQPSTGSGVSVTLAPRKNKAAAPAMNYSRSNGRLRMRSSGGCHSSSKTTRGRARAASRQGKGGRHSTKEKRWTRETIEALERQADAILGERPLDAELNFIPEAERQTEDFYEYEEPERDSAIEKLFDKKNEFEELFGA